MQIEGLIFDPILIQEILSYIVRKYSKLEILMAREKVVMTQL